VKVFFLCGGLGTRLRKVECRPKAIIPVAGVPFMGYSLRLLERQGFGRICLLLGHGADEVARVFHGERFEHSREREPLGTGGALALAREKAAEWNLILNGDSYAEVIFEDLLREHVRRESASPGGVSLFAVYQDDCRDYGALEIDDGRVVSFREKGVGGPGWINAGVYATGRRFFDGLPSGKFGLETDLLPALAREGRLWAVKQRFLFLDIGTPERLARAEQVFQRISRRPAGAGS